MKTRILLSGLLLSLVGCAYVSSHTQKTIDTKTGLPVEETRMRAYTVLDSQSALAKFRNTTGSQSNAWGNGTYIGTLNESSSGSNVANIVEAVVGAAVRAAIKP